MNFIETKLASRHTTFFAHHAFVYLLVVCTTAAVSELGYQFVYDFCIFILRKKYKLFGHITVAFVNNFNII
jgi:hypothetical protein